MTYHLRRLIADDAYAATFQTMGQYRSALLKAADKMPPRSVLPAAPAVAPIPTPQQISDYLHGLDRIQRELVEREARLLPPIAAAPAQAEQQGDGGADVAITPDGRGIYRNPHQTYLQAEEAECVRVSLDKMGAPTSDDGGALSLVGRIKALLYNSLAEIDKALRGKVNDPDPVPSLWPHSVSRTTTYGLVRGLLRERDALKAKLAEQQGDGGPPYLPCPICNGVEGCDHPVPERKRTAGANVRGLRDLHKELGQMRWIGADDGWDRAIESVRERIAEILDAQAEQQGSTRHNSGCQCPACNWDRTHPESEGAEQQGDGGASKAIASAYRRAFMAGWNGEGEALSVRSKDGQQGDGGACKCDGTVKNCPNECSAPCEQPSARVELSDAERLSRLAYVLENGRAYNGIADDNAKLYAESLRRVLAAHAAQTGESKC